MKKALLILCLLLSLLLILCSCGEGKDTVKDTDTLTETIADTVADTVAETNAETAAETVESTLDIKEWTIIRSEGASEMVKKSLTILQSAIAAETGARLSVATDSGAASGAEIIIGKADRTAADEAAALLENNLDYVVTVSGKDIVILGLSDIATYNAVNYFIENFISDGKVIFPETFVYKDTDNLSAKYVPTVATPNRYTRYADNEGSEIYGAQHLQGMTMDDEGNIYFSFTGIIVKVNQQGEEVGVYKVSDEMISLSTHIGNLYWHEGKIYIGLGISKTSLSKHKRYIGVLDDSVFDNGYIQDSEEDPLLYGLNIAELSIDRTFTNSDGKAVARFGGGGIDGITVGKLPGGGYILPAGYKTDEDITASDGTVYKAGTVLTEDVEVNDDEDYIIAVRTQGSYDTYRYDDDNQQIMIFDFDDITEENLLPMTYERVTNDDDTTIDIKYNMYVYCGYHTYGTQVICYDKTTGDYLLWTYGRSKETNEYPKDSLTVIDGSKKLYMDVVEVGQSVPQDSEHYRIAMEYAENYTDINDLDNDGNRGERLIGWHATLKCVCEKGNIDNHDAIAYGDTGYAARICGINTALQGDNGCISLGNGFYYIAAQSNDDTALREDGVTTQKAYGAQARIYYIINNNGAWEFTRVTSW